MWEFLDIENFISRLIIDVLFNILSERNIKYNV